MTISALFGKNSARQFTAYMTRFAQDFGVPISQPPLVPNTRRALAATEIARDEGLLSPFRDAVMAAHWVDGENIESDDTLARIAKAVGLSPEAVVHAADNPSYLDRIDTLREEANQKGVKGIPTFFLGDTKVVGCQSYEMLSIKAREAGFLPRTA